MKFRYIFTISLLFLLLSNGIMKFAAAQDLLHWKVEAWAGPNYSYRTLRGHNSSVQLIIDGRNRIEKPIVGIETGISISYNLTSHWALASGIQFSEVGEKTLPILLIYDPVSMDTAGSMKLRYRYQAFEIPLMMSYSLLEGKVKIEPSVGIGLSKFYNQHTVAIVDYYDGQNDTTIKHNSSSVQGESEFSNFSFFGMIQVKVNYNLSRRLDLFVAPGFKYYFTPLVKDVSVEEYNYAGRIIAGVAFRW